MKLDILKHELVPPHRILSKKEAERLLKELNVSKGQLPKILVTDAAVKKVKANIGDTLEVTRKSRTAGVSLFYRVVVRE
ncbi:MAG: DNA-directed RNA polymerase subunit H [Candidatus Hydrothermarchaeales archaeon]